MTSSALEILKWCALVLMTTDHVNAAIFDRGQDWMFYAGRGAMPLFAAVFGYNLSRDRMTGEKLESLRNKLLIFGAIAYPFHVIALGQGWARLNILFAFAVAAQCVIWLRQGQYGTWTKELASAAGLIFASGFVLEFGWAAPLLVLAFAWFWIWPKQIHAWLGLCTAFTLLAVANGNWWGALSVPIIFSVADETVPFPRSPWLFWIYYPVHLAALAWFAW